MLLTTWQNFETAASGCHILEDDLRHFEEIGYFQNRQHLLEPLDNTAYIEGPRFRKDDGFHFSLLPIPYVGNLNEADVFVLKLNPGFHDADFFAEFKSPEFHTASIRGLQQDFSADDFWFRYLNPAFSWHPGYDYWVKKFNDIAVILAEKAWDGNVRLALLELSRRLAVIELVPYHSRTYREGSLANHLPSAQLVKRWVKEVLAPRAIRGQAVIVVSRQAATWGLDEQPGSIVCNDNTEARGAHLTQNTRGGRLILDRLLGHRGRGFTLRYDCS